MTGEEALQEARRRWPRGTVRFTAHKNGWLYQVGTLAITNFKFCQKGRSVNKGWEAAFADADKRESAK